VWLAYVDESYNDAFHWVVALLVQADRVNQTQRVLREIVEDAADAFGISDEAELHGYDLFHGENDFQSLKAMPRARIAIYREVFNALVAADAWIIRRGVNKAGLVRRYTNPDSPHRVTMTHLIERVDGFCKGSRGANDLALLIADDHQEKNQLLRDLVVYQESGTWGYLAKKITQVVDTIHFVNSKTNPLIQGADLVAFMLLRSSHTGGNPRSMAAVRGLTKIIHPRIHHAWCWHP
jgi:hypothetical protein